MTQDMVERVCVAMWGANKLVGCSKGYHEGASDTFDSASDELKSEYGFLAQAAIEAIGVVELGSAAAELASFANAYDGIPPSKYFGDTDCELRYYDKTEVTVTLGMLRALRQALTQLAKGSE